MPFGYSKKIFPYPAVQYIPLNFRNVKLIKAWNYPFSQKESKLYLFSDIEEAKKVINNLGLPIKKIDGLKKNELLLIILNGKAKDIKYRGHKTIIITKQDENLAHIFKIKTDYFYKEDLYFVLYSPGAKKLDTKKFSLAQKYF
jgi:hypothetical protein